LSHRLIPTGASGRYLNTSPENTIERRSCPTSPERRNWIS